MQLAVFEVCSQAYVLDQILRIPAAVQAVLHIAFQTGIYRFELVFKVCHIRTPFISVFETGFTYIDGFGGRKVHHKKQERKFPLLPVNQWANWLWYSWA